MEIELTKCTVDIQVLFTMCADNNLLDRWLDLIHNPRPGLIVVDMQNDFITGIQPTSSFRDGLHPILEGLDKEISILYRAFSLEREASMQYKPF